MIESSSGEEEGEVPSISLTISRIFDRCGSILFQVNTTIKNGTQDCSPANGSTCIPVLHPILLWVQHGQLLHHHYLPGMVNFPKQFFFFFGPNSFACKFHEATCICINNIFSDGKHPSWWESCLCSGCCPIRPWIQVHTHQTGTTLLQPFIIMILWLWWHYNDYNDQHCDK